MDVLRQPIARVFARMVHDPLPVSADSELLSDFEGGLACQCSRLGWLPRICNFKLNARRLRRLRAGRGAHAPSESSRVNPKTSGTFARNGPSARIVCGHGLCGYPLRFRSRLAVLSA
jgi:hypothetical protein